ncbi:MAG TPA: hypothetical protein VGG64_15855 [Pirellulales bacterium]|jgi:hypothetical protein
MESTSFGVRVVVDRTRAKDLRGTIIDYEPAPEPGVPLQKSE